MVTFSDLEITLSNCNPAFSKSFTASTIEVIATKVFQIKFIKA
ncbi:hypothetical protein DF16_orf02482 [Bacillus thuringiensis serovar kurstaki str. YBT-1520]|jgi:hypothetical protein|nr:hypothetical protein DF16_orf02482 [Bacillus thuringiensis serovar kurstaki str. YBT-1520]